MFSVLVLHNMTSAGKLFQLWEVEYEIEKAQQANLGFSVNEWMNELIFICHCGQQT